MVSQSSIMILTTVKESDPFLHLSEISSLVLIIVWYYLSRETDHN